MISKSNLHELSVVDSPNISKQLNFPKYGWFNKETNIMAINMICRCNATRPIKAWFKIDKSKSLKRDLTSNLKI